MHEARSHQRIAFSLHIGLRKSADVQVQHCCSHDIGFGGLFAMGARGFAPDEPVRLSIGFGNGDDLRLDGRIARIAANGVGCRFTGGDPSSLELLKTLLTPTWDGKNLLEGVVRSAPWHPKQDLADWMRLTSLVSDWQRLTRRNMSASAI